MIADGEVGHRSADSLDDTGTLVTVDLWSAEELGRQFTRQQVGVAHPSCHHPHEHFVVAWFLEAQLFDREWGVAGPHHCGSYLHRSVSCGCGVARANRQLLRTRVPGRAPVSASWRRVT